jgi:hypothetical protein
LEAFTFHSIQGTDWKEVTEFLVSVFIALGAMFFIFKLRSLSQAGRRRFEPGLPLQNVSHLTSWDSKSCALFLLLNMGTLLSLACNSVQWSAARMALVASLATKNLQFTDSPSGTGVRISLSPPEYSILESAD